MQPRGHFFIAGAIVAVAGLGAYLWQRAHAPVVPVEAGTPAVAPAASVPAAAASAAPTILHPIEAAASAASDSVGAPIEAGSLEARVSADLNALVGVQDAVKFLQLDGFVRRLVATVDNLDNQHASARLWPVTPTPGRFATVGAGVNLAASPDNELRYAPFVQFVETVDASRAVALYVRLYPAFQQAYEELGYPGRYFNDRLVEVIEHLLATPDLSAPAAVTLTEIKGPIPSARPWLHYRFSDPAFEALSSGQKMLLRTGPVNERRLKTELRELHRLLTGGALRR